MAKVPDLSKGLPNDLIPPLAAKGLTPKEIKDELEKQGVVTTEQFIKDFLAGKVKP